jgi:hypothetical protein
VIKVANRKFFLLLSVIILAICALAYIVFVEMPIGESVFIQETGSLIALLEDGDIICRFGDRLYSHFFRGASIEDRRYSHTGIIRINDGFITVIHAEGTTRPGEDYVREDPLEEFISVSRAIGIYRLNIDDTSLISSKALEYIGIPFDWQWDMNDNSKLYCTELLYVILKDIAPEIELSTVYMKEIGKVIIPLEAISNSENFSMKEEFK